MRPRRASPVCQRTWAARDRLGGLSEAHVIGEEEALHLEEPLYLSMVNNDRNL